MTPASSVPSGLYPRRLPSRALGGDWLRVRERARVFRHSRRDALLVAIALVHAALGAALVMSARRAPTGVGIAFVAVGLWWGSNTVSHNHLHNPIFVSGGANRVFSALLSVALGIPQTIWKERHLRHHAGQTANARPTRLGRLGVQGVAECALVLATWGALLAWSPRFALSIYAPGYLLGLALCAAQGHFEHLGDDTTAGCAPGAPGVSHYGALYNRLWFNDGHHAEHHRRPTEHWSRLPLHRARTMELPRFRASAYPPVVRWLETPGGWRAIPNRVLAGILGALEHAPIASTWVRRWVVASHARAFGSLLQHLDVADIRRIGVVGGGLFPRTVIVLRALLPGRDIVVIDASARSIDVARRALSAADGRDVEFVKARFDRRAHADFDLLVFPLAYVGDRASLYRSLCSTRTAVIVHDWMWRRRGDAGALVSPLLLKRVNLVRANHARPAPRAIR